MAITPNNTNTTSGHFEPGLEPDAETRIRAAFAHLNTVLAEAGSNYGAFGKFAKGELIRTMLIELPADGEESVEVEKTWISNKSDSKTLYKPSASV